ncbi:MAG: hypothetical protein IH984_06960 [Planctomycetes bacterium]|nr:hypothetical protein [Planctomycetota bacterium]
MSGLDSTWQKVLDEADGGFFTDDNLEHGCKIELSSYGRSGRGTIIAILTLAPGQQHKYGYLYRVESDSSDKPDNSG